MDGVGNETICIRRQLLRQPLCTFYIIYAALFSFLFLILCNVFLPAPCSKKARAAGILFPQLEDFDAMIKHETMNEKNKFTPLIA